MSLPYENDFDTVERVYLFEDSELALINERRGLYYALGRVTPQKKSDPLIPCLVGYRDNYATTDVRALRIGHEVFLEHQKVEDGRYYVKGHWAIRAVAAFERGEFGGEEVTLEELLEMLPKGGDGV